MTCEQHLIENAIYAIARNIVLSNDVNATYTKCTLTEAREMANHVVFSLYNGILPTDDFSKVVRCNKCTYYDEKEGCCKRGTYISGNPEVDFCSEAEEKEVKSPYTD